MPVPSQGLVTGRTSHEVYLLQDGVRRWVPDLWTMRESGSSPADLQILEEQDLRAIPLGEPLTSPVPGPDLSGVKYVESENAMYEVTGQGRLRPITQVEAKLLPAQDNFDRDAFAASVVYLPASLIRGLIEEVQS